MKRKSPAWLAGARHPGAFLERHFGRLLPLPAALTIGALIFFPLAFNVYMSLQSWFVSSTTPPAFVGLKNYLEIFGKDARFWNAVWITVKFTGVSVVLQLALGLAIALYLHREFTGRGLVRTVMLLPMVSTPAAVALIWVVMFNPSLGILNYFLTSVGLPPLLWLGHPRTALASLIFMDTWKWTPFMTLILHAGLQSLPVTPFEAARIDGASRWQLFHYVTLPLLRPSIAVALIFRTMDSLKTFDTIYVMTEGGPNNATEILNLYTFQSGFKYFHLGYASALAVVLVGFVFAVNLILIKLRERSWSY
ncbi:MAG TPA: sugar ABC transporter permease [Candidatus Sulfotelmatobacter sp.]|nr:sugar ABC transporter permease [Candidatus Sulfotelmatobacter sp.]